MQAANADSPSKTCQLPGCHADVLASMAWTYNKDKKYDFSMIAFFILFLSLEFRSLKPDIRQQAFSKGGQQW